MFFGVLEKRKQGEERGAGLPASKWQGGRQQKQKTTQARSKDWRAQHSTTQRGGAHPINASSTKKATLGSPAHEKSTVLCLLLGL